MKTFILATFLTLSLEGYAQQTNEVLVIRNSQTPNQLEVKMKIPMTEHTCENFKVIDSKMTIAGKYNPQRSEKERICINYKKVVRHEIRKVKIVFKSLPQLGGSEEEVFFIKAVQSTSDRSSIQLEMSVVKSISNFNYELKKKKFSNTYTIIPAL